MAPPLKFKPTLRSIAQQAGVSPMAISLALRNRPGLAPATRERLLKLAAEAGYHPDPTISKLMYHLRKNRSSRLQAVICAMTTYTDSHVNPYLESLVEGARRQAEDLGYGLDFISLGDPPRYSTRRLQSILRGRGVEGILLLPMVSIRSFDDLLDWTEFSVVAASFSMTGPAFHHVVPNQFDDTLLVCRKLTEAGCRRIGMVTTRLRDACSHHQCSAAMAWYNQFAAGVPVRPLVADEPLEIVLPGWFEHERPDAIISYSDKALDRIANRLGLSPEGPVRLASVSVRPGDGVARFAGIDQHPDQVGRSALDTLARLIRHGEKGVPEHPSVTMINGVWVDGPSGQKRGAGSGDKEEEVRKDSGFRFQNRSVIL